MKFLIVSFLFLFDLIAAQTVTIEKAQLNANDEINKFVKTLDDPLLAVRNNAGNRYNNAVRSLTDARLNLLIAANSISFPMMLTAENQSTLRNCLVGIQQITLSVISFLEDSANKPIYNFIDETETRGQADTKIQIDSLREAISSVTDAKCLTKLGVTQFKIGILYNTYVTSITNCLSNVYVYSDLEMSKQYTPKHSKVRDLVYNIGISLRISTNRSALVKFMDSFCTSDTLQVIQDLQTVVSDLSTIFSGNLTTCFDTAKSLLPEKTPLLEDVQKCS